MKALKILIISLVILIIVYFIYQSLSPGNTLTEISKPVDKIERIQMKIDTLGSKTNEEFCVEYYREILYDIEDNYRSNKLGSNSVENEQWKENLAKKVYAIYAEKFIKQAFYFFTKSNWSDSDLQVIRDETRYLQQATFLQPNSPIDISLNEIHNVLDKYEEILAFIAEVKHFNTSSYGIEDTFPLEEVKSKMQRAAIYLKNNLENEYVNNCIQLRTDLNAVPELYFRSHCNYLEMKIQKWSGEYTRIVQQRIYNDSVWTPLKNQIEALDMGQYKVSNINDCMAMLKLKWDAESVEAYNHYSK
jgi:hypothetical protein